MLNDALASDCRSVTLSRLSYGLAGVSARLSIPCQGASEVYCSRCWSNNSERTRSPGASVSRFNAYRAVTRVLIDSNVLWALVGVDEGGCVMWVVW